MANEKLKNYAHGKGVRLWQVAEKWGVSDSYFSRLLRKDFESVDEIKFVDIVDEIAGTKND